MFTGSGNVTARTVRLTRMFQTITPRPLLDYESSRHIFSINGNLLYKVRFVPLPIVDRSAQEIEWKIRRKVESLEDVKGIRHVTVRLGAKRLDVNIHVFLRDELGTQDAHRIALDIERTVRTAYPNARVSVDTEPIRSESESIWTAVKESAEGVPGSRGAHNVHVQTVDGKLYVDLHLEVSANMTVKNAHDVAEEVEKRIKKVNNEVAGVTVHVESASELISKELSGVETELEAFIQDLAKKYPEIRSVSNIGFRKFSGNVHLVLTCHFDEKTTIKEAHEISSELENQIKKTYPRITRIDIHEEPE
jgi:divalent metal cation (Fe/Co/Zn/Cd) transporter